MGVHTCLVPNPPVAVNDEIKTVALYNEESHITVVMS